MVLSTDHIHKSFENHKNYPVGMGSYKDPSNTLDPNQFETISTFSYLSAVTKRIELVSGILLGLFRDPILLAKQVATLDALSAGRFIFGIGISNVSNVEEFRVFSLPFLSYAERYGKLDEYLSAMEEIWTKPSASFHGKYVNFDDVVVYPKPVRKPRVKVWLGSRTLGSGKDHPSVSLALRHADGQVGGLLRTPEAVRSIIQNFNSSAGEVGRDVSDFDWCFAFRMSLGETDDEAKLNSRWVQDEQTNMSSFAGYMWKLKDAPKTNVEWAAIGRSSLIVKKLEELVDAGATHLDLWFTYSRYEQLLKQMNLFAKEVMPSFT